MLAKMKMGNVTVMSVDGLRFWLRVSDKSLKRNTQEIISQIKPKGIIRA